MVIKYRPEIDGLRTIAVSAVILYHAQLNIFDYSLFKGGFIGVDIFFVISGYLITLIILKELISKGSFSFKNFYERRIRRILPVLLFVITFSLPLAWIFLLPSSFIEYSKSIIYSIGFTSNIYFWHSGQQYGAESGFLKPFLHTWSLSVEEQYYIIFPIVLFIVFKFIKKYLIHFLILSFIISLGLADWGSRNYPSFNYYILPTRGWEILAGSILAYFETRFSRRSKNHKLNLIFPSVGFLVILHYIVFFNEGIPHPSLYTLLPIIGTCLIIWFSNKDELITKILSNKFFVKLGLISYSLYLWHYPIFAFARINSIHNKISNMLILILLTLILSILSYYYIEKPFRNKNYSFKKISLILFSITAFVVIFNLLSIKYKGFEGRFPGHLLRSNFDEMYIQKEFWQKCSFNKIKNNSYCQFGNFNKKVYLIGDSTMIPLGKDLGEKLEKENHSLIIFYQPGHIFFRQSRIEKRDKILQDVKNSILIFGGEISRENEFDLREMKKKYEINFDLYEKNNNKIILIYPFPELDLNYNINLLNFYRMNGYLKDKYKDYDKFREETSRGYKFYDDLMHDNIYRIYPEHHMCFDKKCFSIKENNILVDTVSHASKFLSDKINTNIMNIIKNLDN